MSVSECLCVCCSESIDPTPSTKKKKKKFGSELDMRLTRFKVFAFVQRARLDGFISVDFCKLEDWQQRSLTDGRPALGNADRDAYGDAPAAVIFAPAICDLVSMTA